MRHFLSTLTVMTQMWYTSCLSAVPLSVILRSTVCTQTDHTVLNANQFCSHYLYCCHSEIHSLHTETTLYLLLTSFAASIYIAVILRPTVCTQTVLSANQFCSQYLYCCKHNIAAHQLFITVNTSRCNHFLFLNKTASWRHIFICFYYYFIAAMLKAKLELLHCLY